MDPGVRRNNEDDEDDMMDDDDGRWMVYVQLGCEFKLLLNVNVFL